METLFPFGKPVLLPSLNPVMVSTSYKGIKLIYPRHLFDQEQKLQQFSEYNTRSAHRENWLPLRRQKGREEIKGQRVSGTNYHDKISDEYVVQHNFMFYIGI